MSSPAPASSYMPHINGLRALAILGVLIYHLRASYCPAGYFGVDLFLVISGYLLLRSLLKPGVEQNFHYGSYLLKKAWRILPSWFAVTLVVCIVALLLLHPGRLADIMKTARYSAMFHADYYIDESGDYFNAFSRQNPLLHYWYLSITQQLYIIAPLLLIPLTRYCSRKAAIILLTILSLLSFAYYILTTAGFVPTALKDALLHGVGTQTAYFHLIPRFWEIAAGFGILLLPEFAGRPLLRGVLGLAGLLGIVASFYLYSTGSPAIYLTVFCSLLTLRYASSGPAALLLNSKPVQALGTISFSLYLWHWPIMVFWKYCCFDKPGPWDEAGMVVASLLLGTLSWWTIERIKTPRLTGWKGTLLRCSLLLTLPFVLVSATKIHKHTRKQALAEKQERRPGFIANPVAETDAAVLRGLENILKEHGMKRPVLRLGTTEATPSFFVMGDSHSMQIYDALHQHCTRLGLRGVHLNNHVTPFWNYVQPGEWDEKIADTIMGYLAAHEEIRYVILFLYWEYRFTDLYRTPFEVTPELMDTKVSTLSPVTARTGKDWRTGEALDTARKHLSVTEPGLDELCDRLKAMGKEVIILGDTPYFIPPSPLDEYERCQQFRLPYVNRSLTQQQHEARQANAHRIHKRLEAERRAHYIDLAPALCVDGIYPDMIDGQFLYQDEDHLSASGSQRAVDYIMPQLLNIIRPEAPPAAP